MISISDEMPGPWRPAASWVMRVMKCRFQSQTRCQAPGDPCIGYLLHALLIYFNLRRDARPLATSGNPLQLGQAGDISISDEMPGPWRPSYHFPVLVGTR